MTMGRGIGYGKIILFGEHFVVHGAPAIAGGISSNVIVETKESDKNKDLGEELADVLFVVLCLANQTGVDLQESFDKKLDLKSKRDHDRHHNNEKLK